MSVCDNQTSIGKECQSRVFGTWASLALLTNDFEIYCMGEQPDCKDQQIGLAPNCFPTGVIPLRTNRPLGGVFGENIVAVAIDDLVHLRAASHTIKGAPTTQTETSAVPTAARHFKGHSAVVVTSWTVSVTWPRNIASTVIMSSLALWVVGAELVIHVRGLRRSWVMAVGMITGRDGSTALSRLPAGDGLVRINGP
jgi:hypothetical protein